MLLLGPSTAPSTPGVNLPQRPATAAATPGARAAGTPGAALRPGGDGFNPAIARRAELNSLLKPLLAAMEHRAAGDVLGKVRAGNANLGWVNN